jgi:hypothetical protein
MVRTCEQPWRRAACGEPCHQWTYLQMSVSDKVVKCDEVIGKGRQRVQREGGGS